MLSKNIGARKTSSVTAVVHTSRPHSSYIHLFSINVPNQNTHACATIRKENVYVSKMVIEVKMFVAVQVDKPSQCN